MVSPPRLHVMPGRAWGLPWGLGGWPCRHCALGQGAWAPRCATTCFYRSAATLLMPTVTCTEHSASRQVHLSLSLCVQRAHYCPFHRRLLQVEARAVAEELTQRFLEEGMSSNKVTAQTKDVLGIQTRESWDEVRRPRRLVVCSAPSPLHEEAGHHFASAATVVLLPGTGVCMMPACMAGMMPARVRVVHGLHAWPASAQQLPCIETHIQPIKCSTRYPALH